MPGPVLSTFYTFYISQHIKYSLQGPPAHASNSLPQASRVNPVILNSSSFRPLFPQLLPQFFKILLHALSYNAFLIKFCNTFFSSFFAPFILSQWCLNALHIGFQCLFPNKHFKATHFPLGITFPLRITLAMSHKFWHIVFFLGLKFFNFPCEFIFNQPKGYIKEEESVRHWLSFIPL